jgi:hypothetical protein
MRPSLLPGGLSERWKEPANGETVRNVGILPTLKTVGSGM